MSTTNHLTMRDLPLGDRPYEKLQKFGAKALSDAELLAIVIRSGSRSESALALCQRLLVEGGRVNPGLASLDETGLEELTQFPGIGKVKAAQLKAACEIGCRVAAGYRNSERATIRSPEDAIQLLDAEMRVLPIEETRTILLDARNRVIRICRIAEGGLAAAVIQPRELFREAIKANAAALIFVHNHPSGDSSPSRQDIETTHRLVDLGEMMGIRVVDHLIIAGGGSISLKQQGLI